MEKAFALQRALGMKTKASTTPSNFFGVPKPTPACASARAASPLRAPE
jgi:hypothetical protein